MRTLLLIVALVAPLVGQDSPGSARPTLRLMDIRTVYVHPLGEDDDAAMAREMLIAGIAKAGRLTVVDEPSKADAQIVGRVQTTRGERVSLSSNMWGTYGGGGTTVERVAVLRIVDAAKTTIWAWSSTDRKPFNKTLLKAIEEEEKAAKREAKRRRE